MDKNKISKIFNLLILTFLTLQISSISFSIAVSSLAFGIWGGLWIIQIIYERSINYDKNTFRELKLSNIFLLAYFIFEIISRIFAVIPEGAFIGLKRLLVLAVFFITIIKISSKEDLYRIIIIILIVFSAISVYEITDYLLSLNELLKNSSASEIRMVKFSYPITSGEMKMFIILSLFPVIIQSKKIILRRVYLILLLLPMLISMYLTQSRNVFLAFFICLVIYGLFNKKFLIAYFLVIIAASFLLPQTFKERIASIFDPKHPSNANRIIMWETGLKMFKEHPVTGVGDNEITMVYKKYKSINSPGEGSHLHSNYIMILATTGFFGFVAYIGYWISILITQIKFYKYFKDPFNKALILGSILTFTAFHIAGIFEWIFGDHEVMTVFFFFIAIPFVIFKLNANGLSTVPDQNDRLFSRNF